jgi:asparagine synthase (glutamine-hydrolysing)
VSLSGDGGDELFTGYNRYFWGRNIWNTIGWMPLFVRNAAARLITVLSPRTWNRFIGGLRVVLPENNIILHNFGDRLHKFSKIMSVKNPEALYFELISNCKDPESVVINSHEPSTVLNDNGDWRNMSDFVRRMMYLDMVSYLPDDILVKVDRASMGVSLEARVPMLDHRFVEFAWQVPLSMKIRNNTGKWLLRRVLYKYVPRELIDRPKMGFEVPIEAWLRGPLREWAEGLIDRHRLLQESVFNPDPIRQKWKEHLSGVRNWQHYLWSVLMFQAWLDGERK